MLKNKFVFFILLGFCISANAQETFLETPYTINHLLYNSANKEIVYANDVSLYLADFKTLKVKDSVKQLVNFRQLNLLGSYSLMGRFDIVFCRNVLIYFSPEIKAKILSQIHGVLNKGGYLFLGASESLSGLNQDFDMIRCNPGIVYQKK